ncbi:hypothetical protein FQN54_007470 [Arachnomyces sp. PD_36]|nr:hypothetical protein FQN54_007470 [Arachnomyces sp. PD_36]
MKSVLSCLTFAAAASALVVPGAKVNYDGYKIVRVPTGAGVDDMITQLSLPTWEKNSAHIDVMVPPSVQKKFDSFTSGLKTKIMHENLGNSILKEDTFNAYAAGNANTTWFQSYHPYQDHLQFLADLAEAHPENAEVVTEGKSSEGRAITGIHLYGADGPGKPAIVFHGTVHAREWITTMVNEYITYSLLDGYAGDEEVKKILDTYDFYVFPVVNPDGFVYTQTNDRMWRKNRQENGGSQCLGRDVNRNWPHKWDGEGSSEDPCNETYRGEEGGDSPEVKALIAQLNKVKESQGVKAYIDWHSYSQLFMTPYGYTCSTVPDNNEKLQTLAGSFVDALQGVHGTSYEYGPICQTIYQTPGSSVDFNQDVVGTEYVFTAELRDTGDYGFILPAEQIVPTGEETWEGVKALIAGLE